MVYNKNVQPNNISVKTGRERYKKEDKMHSWNVTRNCFFFNEKGVLLDRYIKRHNFFLVFRQYEHHFTVRQTARTCCLAYSLASTRQQNECLEGKANSI